MDSLNCTCRSLCSALFLSVWVSSWVAVFAGCQYWRQVLECLWGSLCDSPGARACGQGTGGRDHLHHTAGPGSVHGSHQWEDTESSGSILYRLLCYCGYPGRVSIFQQIWAKPWSEGSQVKGPQTQLVMRSRKWMQMGEVCGYGQLTGKVGELVVRSL